jgi:hypothetical protein
MNPFKLILAPVFAVGALGSLAVAIGVEAVTGINCESIIDPWEKAGSWSIGQPKKVTVGRDDSGK